MLITKKIAKEILLKNQIAPLFFILPHGLFLPDFLPSPPPFG